MSQSHVLAIIFEKINRLYCFYFDKIYLFFIDFSYFGL